MLSGQGWGSALQIILSLRSLLRKGSERCFEAEDLNDERHVNHRGGSQMDPASLLDLAVHKRARVSNDLF